ncbi:hypothetical protein GC093_34800 [Paenibacillus sp. LMG 31456]|uniref:Uncharacterized protein n=1 Tax=Paenibacillus foliorum TaxID=2654974 RepID=A0A972GXD4_9BACL|nr:hypothetical protein [Paenibacillus foliorum]
MIVREQQLSKESTVYHYRLLQRIHTKRIYFGLYWGVVAALYIWDLIRFQPFSLVIGLIIIPLLHTLLIYLYYKLKEKRRLANWLFQLRLPWIGFVPTNYIAMRRLMRLHLQLLWIPIVICACFYPWVSLDLILHLLFVHFWLLLPRFIIFFRFRNHLENGFLKINEQDTSCYAQ